MHAPHVTKFCKKHNEELYYSPDTARVGCFICHGEWLKEERRRMEEKIKAKGGRGWYEKKDPVLGKARRHSEVAKKDELESALRSPVKCDWCGDIVQLERILGKAKISSNLRYAVEETVKALEQGNMRLAADLSAVKSLVGDMKDIFGEDSEYNNKVLGESVYSILDGMHHDLARVTGTIPSGMMILTAGGRQERAPSRFEHPILKMMTAERNKIRREAERRWEKQGKGG